LISARCGEPDRQVAASGRSDRAAALRILAEYGVPFATFDAWGACTALSESAVALLESDPSAAAAWRQASALASAAVAARGRTEPRSAPITPAPHAQWQLRTQVLPPGDARQAVIVLFLPVRTDVDGEPPYMRWGLTTREADVARLLARGESTKAVAAALGISAHTARRHTERVFAKLGVQTRAQVVLMLGAAARPSSHAAEPNSYGGRGM